MVKKTVVFTCCVFRVNTMVWE